MILVHGREWNILCDLISASEQAEIEKQIVSSTLRPRTIFFDEERLRPELLVKLKKLLNIKPE
jgi:hypothetical protein